MINDEIINVVNEYISNSGDMYPMKFLESKDDFYKRIYLLILHENSLNIKYSLCSETHDEKQRYNFNYCGQYGGKRCTECNKFFNS
uniref:Uncharacterized protein n=1 Tax=viral metagenome TaxID=1070528 RepID=A0A6C0AE66_9ZZZZ